MHSLPIPKEGEVYSLALHPAYFRDFLDHPFTVNRETQDYQELFESIKTYGIREPIKCRPGRDGGVEIISGHRRHDIGMQLNYPIPTIIEQIGDDDAQIQCVDCNLHRKDIPLSELARATEMKMDALKRKQGRRSKADILSGKEPIKRSDELVGEDLGMSRASVQNRIVSFDLYEMGEQLKPTALNVTMETIQNRVAANRLAGKYTWVFLDEIYLFFKYYYSAQFLYKCWKRFRKYGAAMTGATQNVEECLRSDTARLMFANSEFLVLLNQAATDRAELARLLNISETQMGHVTGAEAGHGLLRIGGSIVPFANEFPRSGELYRLWSTTPGDK